MSALSRRRWDYDLLRVASMVGVVYLHTAAGALRQLGTPLWHFSNLLSSLATAAVPLFFMLSGALLLSHPRTAELGTLFRRRLPKVLIPLLAWSGVVIALAGVLSGPQAALDKLIPLLNTPVMVPYWFLYALVPIYLVSPLLKKMTDGLSEAHWNYLVGLWLIATIGMDTLCDLAPAGPWQSALTVHWTLNLDFVGGYLGYFLLGARLARLQKLPRRGALWGATAASFAVIAAGTFWLTSRTGVYDERIKSYLHLFTACWPRPCSCWRAPMGRAGAAGGPSPPCPGCPSASTWYTPWPSSSGRRRGQPGSPPRWTPSPSSSATIWPSCSAAWWAWPCSCPSSPCAGSLPARAFPLPAGSATCSPCSGGTLPSKPRRPNHAQQGGP